MINFYRLDILKTLFLVAALSTGRFATAQEYSAITVVRDSTHVLKGKEYRSGNKVRMDGEQAGACNEQAYSILDVAQRTHTLVMLCRKVYVQKPARPNELQMLAVGESPCPIASGKVSCNDMGSETINGRKAEKWEIRQSARLGGDLNEQIILSRIWVDSKLHVWVKFESTVGDTFMVSNELQDIQEGRQPASLFVIPAGLRKSEF